MSRLQIMGLSSGMDYDIVIGKALELERIPITRMTARKNVYKQQQDAWRDINTRLSALDTKLTDLRLSSTFHGRIATSSDDKLVTATAGSQAIKGTYEINIEHRALAHRIASDGEVGELTYDAGDEVINITVGEGDNQKTTEITIKEGSELAAIVKEINDAGAGVKATVIGNRLVLESEMTGTSNQIQLNGSKEFLVDQLKLGTGVDSEGNLMGMKTIQEAQDAAYSINGIPLISESNTIKDVVQGVTFNLRDTGTAQITVKQDVDQAVGKIRAFVDQYNSVMSFIAEKTKVTMTDAGEIGSVGTLQGDGTANRLREALRFQTTSPIDADLDYNQLAVLGITTNREGTLQIDETKLRAALEENPEDVAGFFNKKADNMKDFIKGYVEYGTGILAEKQESIGSLMKDIDRQIERLEDRIARKEENLVRQFTALEKVLTNLQTQSDWLTQQINQLSAWAPNNRRR
ncbi:MAG: flagellar filament capping protein FliD [Firmicutes bacterium]|nr:flagellar filament capping protein FliD [Bacillota bacterium]